MTEWQKSPFKIEVKNGDTKAFCMCGASKNGPYCDGSHQGTGKRPEVIKFDQDKTVFVCGCQKSAKAPFCDGTHAK